MRGVVPVLVAASLVAVAPGRGAGVPGTPQFAVPERGTAVVVPGPTDSGRTFAPLATGARVFTVFARLRQPVPRGATRVLVRHKAPSGRCARSFAEDGGTAIGLGRAFADRAGYLALSSKELRWRSAGKRRFCLWLTADPGTRVRPVTQVIAFTGPTIGALQWLYTGADGVASISTTIRSTDPYSVVSTSTGCPPDRTDERTADRRSGDFYEQFEFVFGRSDCDPRTTHAITSPVAGQLTVSMSYAEAAAGAIQHSGACVFDDFRATVPEAKALIAAQSCRVGRTLAAPTSDDTKTPGDVWVYTVHGSPVELVPVGTTVDLVVNR